MSQTDLTFGVGPYTSPRSRTAGEISLLDIVKLKMGGIAPCLLSNVLNSI